MRKLNYKYGILLLTLLVFFSVAPAFMIPQYNSLVWFVSFTAMIISVLLFCLMYGVLIPKLYMPGYLKLFWLISVMVFLLALGVGILLFDFVEIMSDGVLAYTYPMKFIAPFILNSISMAMGAFLCLLLGWESINVLIDETESKRLTKELISIHARYQPDLVIRSLEVMQHKSESNMEQMPYIIEKLAGILRYSVYDCNDQWQKAEREVGVFIDYLYLINVVENNEHFVLFEDNSQEDQLLLPPMFLIDFVEWIYVYFDVLCNDRIKKIIVRLEEDDLVPLLIVRLEHGLSETDFMAVWSGFVAKGNEYLGERLRNFNFEHHLTDNEVLLMIKIFNE